MKNQTHADLNNTFKALDPAKDDLKKQVVDTLVNALKKQGARSKKEHAQVVLCDLFGWFSYDFKSFLLHYQLTDDETTKFLSYILSEIYYNEPFLAHVDASTKKEYLENTLIILLAETLSRQRLQDILSLVSEHRKILLVVHCMEHFREGAWNILEALEYLYGRDRISTTFIKGVRSKYYNINYLSSIIDNPHLKLSAVVQKLELYAEQQVQEIMKTLPVLVELITSLPMRGFDFIEEMKRKIDPSVEPTHESEKNKQKAMQSEIALKEMFGKYSNESYTLKEACQFFRIFGLSGQYLGLPIIKKHYAPLSDILKELLELFGQSTFIKDNALNPLIKFVLSILTQLYAYYREPSQYSQGLNSLIYAISTRGDNLPQLPWLPSIIKGLKEISIHLHDAGIYNFQLSNYPIIIFDQASKNNFTENQAYINSLMMSDDVQIWHISRNETLQLAKKLKLTTWIKTAPRGLLGFGGARNCVTMLAPVIAEASRRGICSIKELLKCRYDELDEMYREKVLGINHQDSILHIGEDDVVVPACNIFSDALFAQMKKDLYFCRSSFYVGRGTQFIYPYIDAANILINPATAVYSSRWLDFPKISGVGMLTKPKFSLPTYFGNEEHHSNPSCVFLDYFHQPLIHLSGPRYPKKLLPFSPLDGLAAHLKVILPYTIQMSMSSWLIDGGNALGQCILPWKDADTKGKMLNNFQNLNQLWQFASRPDTLQELQKRFWCNMDAVFNDKIAKNSFLADDVEALTDIDSISQMPSSLKKYYKKIQKDAQMFFVLGKTVIKYHKQGVKNYLEKAQSDVKNKFQFDIARSNITRDLSHIISYINSLSFSGNH